SSAGGHANIGSVLGTVGGRYAFASLEEGPFVAARADLGGVDYQSSRQLGGALGTARGSASGALYSGQAVVGDVLRLGSLRVTPQAGIRVTHVTLGALPETGSELALDGHPIGHTASSLLARVELGFEPWLVNGWSVAPTATLGAELALGNTLVAGTASLYGFTINQYAAFDSRYLLQGGLGVGAQHGAFAMHVGLNMVHGDHSTGVNGQLSVACRF
ncbi:MAG TPA: autotransporter outer membrane beta-barrel domain-containing protein, partial [Acetobacteraceae bacterium]|nr:autotransporter outer membrane beta-barrel domain-containing protein [Acetobacteraceae bacterium]